MTIRELKIEVKNIQRTYQKLQREVDELIWSLVPMASPELRRRLQAAREDSTLAAATPSRGGQGRQTRPRYDAEVKQQLKAALQAGMTAEQASRKFGPSTFTIKLWKREWGLVKARAKKNKGTERNASA